MNDETKATLFSIAYVAVYTLCIINARLDLLIVFTGVFAGILFVSAKMEKAERRLQRYKDDAARRGREEMADDDEQPRIVMTKGKAS